jgi:beta-glucanase (GH16 family)
LQRLIRVSLLLCLAATLGMAQPQERRSIDLSRYKLVFDEPFSKLDVSAWGPGTRWIAHTPWKGDFGDAQFADPASGFPFTVSNGVLRIEARKGSDSKWQSGLLASQSSPDHGFALQYGYFEIRAKMPPGPGVWPAFWLDSFPPPDSSDPSVEIDVIEYYGQFPGAYNSTVIVWPHAKNEANRSEGHTQRVRPGSLYQQFHTYGVSVDSEWIVMYFDRVETWRARTPPEHKHGFMILLNLALGSGWPIDKTPNPSYMYVDYVRAYAPRS